MGVSPEALPGEEAPLAMGDRLQGEATWWEASSLGMSFQPSCDSSLPVVKGVQILYPQPPAQSRRQ